MPQLQSRVAEQIGGRVYFAQLAAQVLDLSEPMMSRAYALKRLAESGSRPRSESVLATQRTGNSLETSGTSTPRG